MDKYDNVRFNIEEVRAEAKKDINDLRQVYSSMNAEYMELIRTGASADIGSRMEELYYEINSKADRDVYNSIR